MYQKTVKRGLDIVISLTALVLLSPVLLVTAVFVRVKLGAPVIFRQGQMLHIIHIQRKTFLPANCISAVYLRPSREPRSYVMPLSLKIIVCL